MLKGLRRGVVSGGDANAASAPWALSVSAISPTKESPAPFLLENMACFDRDNLIGNRVSSEQPSVIDDPPPSRTASMARRPSSACFAKKIRIQHPRRLCDRTDDGARGSQPGNLQLHRQPCRADVCLRRRQKPSGCVGRSRQLRMPRFPCFGILQRTIPAGKAPQRGARKDR